MKKYILYDPECISRLEQIFNMVLLRGVTFGDLKEMKEIIDSGINGEIKDKETEENGNMG